MKTDKAPGRSIAGLRPLTMIAFLLSALLHAGAAAVVSLSAGEAVLQPGAKTPDLDPVPVIQVHFVRPVPKSPQRPAVEASADEAAKPSPVAARPPRQADPASPPSPLLVEASSNGSSTGSSPPSSKPGMEGQVGLRGRCLWRGELSEREKAICLGRESGQS